MRSVKDRRRSGYIDQPLRTAGYCAAYYLVYLWACSASSSDASAAARPSPDHRRRWGLRPVNLDGETPPLLVFRLNELLRCHLLWDERPRRRRQLPLPGHPLRAPRAGGLCPINHGCETQPRCVVRLSDLLLRCSRTWGVRICPGCVLVFISGDIPFDFREASCPSTLWLRNAAAADCSLRDQRCCVVTKGGALPPSARPPSDKDDYLDIRGYARYFSPAKRRLQCSIALTTLRRTTVLLEDFS